MSVIKFNKEHRNPFLFENDDYRVEYQTPSVDSSEYTYLVFDKKQNDNMRLEFSTDESNTLCIALYKDGEKPLHLKAVEPYLYKSAPVKDDGVLNNHAVSVESSRSGKQSAENLMRVYRALDKGDFIVDVRYMPISEIGPLHNLQTAAQKPSSEVLKFMDTYIFNTPEAKEVLSEYLEKQPAYDSVRNQKASAVSKPNVVKYILNKARGR